MNVGLPRAEGDDAANGVIRGDTNGHPIARHDFDAKSPHPPAQLCENLVPCVALDPIEPTRMDSDDRALHIYEIVFAQ